MSHGRTRAFLLAVALAAAVAAVFANGVQGVFVYDDLVNLERNGPLRQLWPPTSDFWSTPWDSLVGRPLTAFSFAVNYALGGLDPSGYHALNIAIHAVACVALFLAVRALLGLPRAPRFLAARSDAFAFAVALLWGLHPLNTMSVTYVTQRAEALMGMFFLLALWAALESICAERPRRWRISAVVAAVLGALCKEPIAVLPLCVLALDAAFAAGSPRAALRERMGLYLGLCATWVVLALLVSYGGSHRATTGGALPEVTWWAWLTTQPFAIATYLRLAVWPAALVFDYGWPIPESPSEWVPYALLVLALLAATVWALFRAPRTGAVALCFFLTLAPTSSVLPVPFELMSEHRTYLPLAALVGLAVAAAALALARLPAEQRRLAGGALLIVVALALAGRTWARNRDYRDAEELWRRVIARVPENDRAWHHLAHLLRVSGRREEALAAYQRAIELHASFPFYYDDLGTLYLELQRPDLAQSVFQRGLQLDPESATLRANLGEALLQLGRPRLAREAFERALADDPHSGAARRGLAKVHSSQGRNREAVAELETALAIEPNDVLAFESLVLLLATSTDDGVRDGARALALIEARSAAPQGFHAVMLRLWAAALAEVGRYDEAIARASRAVEIAPGEGRADLVPRVQAEIELYRAGKPARYQRP